MAGIFKNILQGLGLGKKTAAAPKPFYRGAGGTLPVGALEKDPHARLEKIPASHVEAATAAESIYVFLQSSMVRGCQYFPITRQLQVDWVIKKGQKSHGGIYDDVSEAEFRDFMRASSKGSWIWRVCIGYGHKRGEPSLKHYTPL